REDAAVALAAAEERAAAARAPVEARFAVPLATLRAAVAAAQAEHEAAARLPEVPPEQAALLARRAEAQRLLAEGERRLAAAAQARQAGEQARDAAAARARAAQAELARHEEAIAEIARQRAALLAPGARVDDAHLRGAREEDRRLLLLEGEFTALFGQARNAVRPLVLQRLPALTRLKEQAEGMPPFLYCTEKRERLEAYFTSAILGLQASVALRGTDASMLSGALVWLGEDALKNFREAQCADPAAVAQALAQNAQERLGAVTLRATALRGTVARETRAAEEAEAARAAAAQAIAAAQAEIRRARAEIEQAGQQLQLRAAEFRAAAEPLAAARQAALEAAGARLEAARAELATVEAAHAAALEAEVPPAAPARQAAEDAAARAREAEAAVEAARDALAEALAADYASRFVAVASRPAPGWPAPGRTEAGGQAALCAEIRNAGPLAVRAVEVDLLFRDHSLAAAGIPAAEALGAYGNGGVLEPVSQTQGREPVIGLAPRARWRTEPGACPVIEIARLAATERGRALAAAAGGADALLARNGAGWRFALRAVRLARPDTLRRTGDAVWSYAVEPHRAVFAAELRQAEEAALAPPPAPEAAAAAPADVVVTLDRATALRVQRALNARAFDAGAADGIVGPRTRDAIRAFQRSLGRPDTGELTREQLDRLLGEPGAAAAG
ncbi:peptidoglycan-binding domain-containing protein, partial [Caldovatus aquaticus]